MQLIGMLGVFESNGGRCSAICSPTHRASEVPWELSHILAARILVALAPRRRAEAVAQVAGRRRGGAPPVCGGNVLPCPEIPGSSPGAPSDNPCTVMCIMVSRPLWPPNFTAECAACCSLLHRTDTKEYVDCKSDCDKAVEGGTIDQSDLPCGCPQR
jgi:hypothetical protein